MNGQSKIDEYPVTWVKRFRSLNKKLRMLTIGNVPIIQIVSIKSRHFEDFDISRAAKVFMGFSSAHSTETMEIILNTKTITLIFLNRQTLNLCRNIIDEMLKAYHSRGQVRGSGLSIDVEHANEETSKTSKNEIRPSPDLINSNSSSTDNMIPDILYQMIPSDNCNQEMPSVYITMTNSNISNEDMLKGNISKRDDTVYSTISNQYNLSVETFPNLTPYEICPHIFMRDYDRPEFNIRTTSLKNEIDHLEIFPILKRSLSSDPVISLAMKIREEISNPGGVEVTILNYKIDQFQVTLFDNRLWISGITDWEHIHGKLHIGDRIIAINDIIVNDLSKYKSMMKIDEDYSFIIQRLPQAQAFIFDKEKFSMQRIKIKGKKLFFKDSESSKLSFWQITELHGENTCNFTNHNQVYNILSKLNSDIQYLFVIIQSKTFLKSLKVFPKKTFSFNR